MDVSSSDPTCSHVQPQNTHPTSRNRHQKTRGSTSLLGFVWQLVCERTACGPKGVTFAVVSAVFLVVAWAAAASHEEQRLLIYAHFLWGPGFTQSKEGSWLCSQRCQLEQFLHIPNETQHLCFGLSILFNKVFLARNYQTSDQYGGLTTKVIS